MDRTRLQDRSCGEGSVDGRDFGKAAKWIVSDPLSDLAPRIDRGREVDVRRVVGVLLTAVVSIHSLFCDNGPTPGGEDDEKLPLLL
jgi:hypothetical protein